MRFGVEGLNKALLLFLSKRSQPTSHLILGCGDQVRPGTGSKVRGKSLEEARFMGSGGWGRLAGKFASLGLFRVSPKSSLALPRLTLALPEPLILPAPSVWICLLPNLHHVYLHGG